MQPEKLHYPIEENAALKEEIKSLKISSAQLEKTRSCQMAEALENLQILSKTHKEELISNQNAAHLKCKTVCVWETFQLHDNLQGSKS